MYCCIVVVSRSRGGDCNGLQVIHEAYSIGIRGRFRFSRTNIGDQLQWTDWGWKDTGAVKVSSRREISRPDEDITTSIIEMRFRGVNRQDQGPKRLRV